MSSDNIYIIDYGAGNLHSIAKAVEEVSGNRNVVVGNNPKEIASSSHVILPGVGAFGDCVSGLKAQDGVLESLHSHAINNEKPFLGVCVGMQMLADKGLEHGEHKGLGWISGVVRPIPFSPELRIPHMGWNDLIINKKHSLLEGINNGDHAYFVHSFYFDCDNESDILSKVDFGIEIPSVVAKGNILATQFHPEKSQNIGIKILNNFLKV